MTCRSSIEYVLKDISETYSIPLDVLREKYINGSPKRKKRGRKKSLKEEYIETEEYTYNGTVYLVDGNHLVYTNNIEAPILVGEKLVDGTIKFNTTSLEP